MYGWCDCFASGQGFQTMTLLERFLMGFLCKRAGLHGHFYSADAAAEKLHLYHVDREGAVIQLDEYEGVPMKPGAVVELKIPPAGHGAKAGARAVVVDGKKEFPDLYRQLLGQVRERDLPDFIWVKWDRSHPHHGGQQDGAYAAARFDLLAEKDEEEPRNNDGRSHCWWCRVPTRKMQGFSGNWDVCPDCGK